MERKVFKSISPTFIPSIEIIKRPGWDSNPHGLTTTASPGLRHAN